MKQLHRKPALRVGGFTLAELLIVVGIITIIAVMLLSGQLNVIEKARVAQAISHINGITRAASLYRADVHTWPPTYRISSRINNPFLTNQETRAKFRALWNGPYMDKYPDKHAWGGHIGWQASSADANGFRRDGYIILDDDAPGTSNDNGRIPFSALIRIDEEIDDGDLSSGRVQGNGVGSSLPFPTEEGELAIRVDL